MTDSTPTDSTDAASDAASQQLQLPVTLTLPSSLGLVRVHGQSFALARRLVRVVEASAGGIEVMAAPHGSVLVVLCAPASLDRVAAICGAPEWASVLSSSVVALDEAGCHAEGGALSAAVEEWMTRKLHVEEGYLRLSEGWLVDVSAGGAPSRPVPFPTASAFRLRLRLKGCSPLDAARSSVEATLSIRFEGRRWNPSADAVAGLLQSDDAIGAQLREAGSVDLSSARWWSRFCDPEREGSFANEISLLPDFAPATIVGLSLTPPRHLPCGPHRTMVPQRRADAASIEAEWAEGYGLVGLTSTAADGRTPLFATVSLGAPEEHEVCSGGSWRVVPAAAVWPRPGMRVARRLTQIRLPTERTLSRILPWLGKVSLLGECLKLSCAAADVMLQRCVGAEPARPPADRRDQEPDGVTRGVPPPPAKRALAGRARPSLSAATAAGGTPPTPAQARIAAPSRPPLGAFSRTSAGGPARAAPTAAARVGGGAGSGGRRTFKLSGSRPEPPIAKKSAGTKPKGAAPTLASAVLVSDHDELRAMRVPELKQQLALRKQKVSGTRAALLERLGVGQAHASGASAAAPPTSSPAASTPAAASTPPPAVFARQPALSPATAAAAAAPQPAAPAKSSRAAKRVTWAPSVVEKAPAATWPGEHKADWLQEASGVLTPVASSLLRCAFARFDADADGGLSPSELSAFNAATGSGELDAEDLAWILSSFGTHMPSGGLSVEGFEAYFVSALRDDETFEETIADVQRISACLAHG